MTEAEIIAKLPELLALPAETEWVEFKHNNSDPQEIGEYVSSLSNSACLHKKDHGYLVFGVENGTHHVLGTKFNPAIEKKGNEALENWVCRLLCIFRPNSAGIPKQIGHHSNPNRPPFRGKSATPCRGHLADQPGNGLLTAV